MTEIEIPRGVIWLVSAILIVAAIIDGWKLKVPNWLTFPLALGGLMFAGWTGGVSGLQTALAGLGLGLILLLPLYAIGGMGAGDVKLLAGVGAWIGPTATLWAFVATVLVGGLMGLVMVVWSGEIRKHLSLFQMIGYEILIFRNPVKLSEIAAGRKASMLLLPYGIPIAVGSIAYFAWMGLFF